MILNENVPCRASRAWWLPFTSLALGLFAMPVAAQKGAQDPVRVEIRVNGKQVEDLNSAERTALLEQLLGAEKKAAAKKQRKVAVRVESEDADAVPSEPVPPRARRTAPVVVEGEPATVEPTPTPARKRPKPAQRAQGEPVEMEIDLSELHQLEGLDLKAMFGEGLAEARLEILGDEDLRELGITDEVVRLLDDVEAGKGITNSLDEVIRGALQGASKLVEKELRADPELAELGMADGLLALVNGLLQNEGNQKLLAGFVRNLLDEAVAEAKVEIRADADLRELGITTEVESLLEAVLRGGDAAGELQGLVDKATKAALQHAESEAVVEPREEPAPPEAQPKPKPKSKSAKKAKPAKRSSTEVESAPK